MNEAKIMKTEPAQPIARLHELHCKLKGIGILAKRTNHPSAFSADEIAQKSPEGHSR